MSKKLFGLLNALLLNLNILQGVVLYAIPKVQFIFPVGANLKSDLFLQWAPLVNYSAPFLVLSHLILIFFHFRKFPLVFSSAGAYALFYFTPLKFFALFMVLFTNSGSWRPSGFAPSTQTSSLSYLLYRLSVALFLTAILMVGLTVPIQHASSTDTIYMFSNNFLFLIPYLFFFTLLLSVYHLCNKIYIAPLGRSLALLSLNGAALYVATLTHLSYTMSSFTSQFDLALLPQLATTLVVSLFSTLLHFGYSNAPRGFSSSFLDAKLGQSFTGLKSILFFIAIFTSAFLIRNHKKDLVDDMLVDVFQFMVPAVLILISLAITRKLPTLQGVVPRMVIVGGLFVLGILPYQRYGSLSKMTVIENHWSYGSFVTKKTLSLYSKLGLANSRPILAKINRLEQIVQEIEPMAPYTLRQPSSLSPKRTKNSPHIFIFVADAISRHRLHAYGHSRSNSPNLDKFAKEATLFENAFANSSDTFQNVVAMFAGQFVGRHPKIGADERTVLCKILKDRGYKFFLAGQSGPPKINQGHCTGATSLSFLGTEDNDLKLLDGQLKENPNTPLLVYIHSMGGHPPWWSYKNRLRGQSQIDTYDGVLAEADTQFGSFVSLLKDNKAYDNTILVYASDHGLGLGEHMDMGSFSNLYAHNTDVPFVIKVPGGKAGRVKTLYQHVDLLPTLADLIDYPLSYKGPGRSLAPTILTGQPSSDANHCVFSVASYREAYASICADGKKVLWYRGINMLSYYDLKKDPMEKTDLMGSLSEKEFERTVRPLAQFVKSGMGTFTIGSELTPSVPH